MKHLLPREGVFVAVLQAQKAPYEETSRVIRNKGYKLKIQLENGFLGLRIRQNHSASLPHERTITQLAVNRQRQSKDWLRLCCESFTVYFSTVLGVTHVCDSHS